MAQSAAEQMISQLLLMQGFKKKRRKYLLDLGSAEVELELQHNSFDKGRHYLNFHLKYSTDECSKEGIPPETAVVFGRADVLDPEKREIFWNALNDAAPMEAQARRDLLSELVVKQTMPFLQELSSLQGGRRLFRRGALNGLAFAQLKEHWEKAGS